MPSNKPRFNLEQFRTQQTKYLSLFGVIVLAIFVLLSLQHDSIFLDRLLPAAGIIFLVLLVRNLGERH